MEEKKGADGLTVYLCLDDRGGLLFNGRRLSRDALVLADLASDAARALTAPVFRPT